MWPPINITGLYHPAMAEITKSVAVLCKLHARKYLILNQSMIYRTGSGPHSY